MLLFITLACGGVHGVSSFSQPAAAVKSSSFRKRPTPGLVRTYGGDREMYRHVATLRILMSWTPAHYTVRESRTGWQSPAIYPPSVQIHQSIRFPAGFCNISTWKASSGRNLKTNFTKTRWCRKTAGGLLPLTRQSHDSEIVVRSAFVKAFPKWRMNRKNRPGLLGLSRRLVTENITSKLSEKCVTASRSIDRRVRTTYGLIFP